MTGNLNHEWFYLNSDQKTDQNTEPIITVPVSKLEIFNTVKVFITWGKKKIEATILPVNEEFEYLSCSKKIFTELDIKVNFPISAMYCKEKKQFDIGPTIGVLTEIYTKNEESLFPSIEHFCKELIQFCTNFGVSCYIYSWHDLKLSNWIGYEFQGDIWLRRELSIPHFFYNRIHSRNISYSKTFHSFLDDVAEQKIPLYNKLYLSKKDMYDFIQSTFLQPFLPNGSILTKQSLHFFLEKYHSVFLKPLFASQGRGIYRIREVENNILIEPSEYNEQSISFSSVELAWNHLALILKEGYLIQEEIQLISIDNQVCDFRVLTHLQADHDWKVTSVTARLGKVNSFISNLAQGGEKGSANTLLRAFFGKEHGDNILQMMKELAIAVSVEINKQLSHSFIELGIDIAVENSGKLKLIELNSKPSKKDIPLTRSPRPSAKAIGQLAIQKGKIFMEEDCSCKP